MRCAVAPHAWSSSVVGLWCWPTRHSTCHPPCAYNTMLCCSHPLHYGLVDLVSSSRGDRVRLRRGGCRYRWANSSTAITMRSLGLLSSSSSLSSSSFVLLVCLAFLSSPTYPPGCSSTINHRPQTLFVVHKHLIPQPKISAPHHKYLPLPLSLSLPSLSLSLVAPLPCPILLLALDGPVHLLATYTCSCPPSLACTVR